MSCLSFTSTLELSKSLNQGAWVCARKQQRGLERWVLNNLVRWQCVAGTSYLISHITCTNVYNKYAGTYSWLRYSVNDHPLDAILYPILLRHFKRNSYTNLWIATPPHLPPFPHPYILYCYLFQAVLIWMNQGADTTLTVRVLRSSFLIEHYKPQ